MNRTNVLALFDLDHTLLKGDSDVEWSRYLVDKGLSNSDAIEKREKYFIDYQNGTLDVDEFLRFQLAALARFSRSELEIMHQEFMKNYIIPCINSEVVRLLRIHQQANHRTLLISATNEFVIQPIASYLGLDHALGVKLEVDDIGRYTGNYWGTVTYQEGKVKRLMEWLEQRGERYQDYEDSYFYSDSFNDIPLLKKVAHPVAVNPDSKLKDYATAAGWRIIVTS